MTQNDPIPSNPSDDAIAHRLGQLRNMPVDISRLRQRLRDRIGQPASQPTLHLWLRPLRAVAASALLIGAIVTALLLWSSRPVLASPSEMAQVYDDVVSGRSMTVPVDSIAAANRELAAHDPLSPSLPQMPGDFEMKCCMHSVHNKHMACLLLKGQSEPIAIAIAVARQSDMKSPPSPTIQRNGSQYHEQSFGNLNMISTARDGRFICLMGRVPIDQLIDLAGQLK